MKTLSKRSIIKTLKKQLTDRINSAKTLKELEGWKITMSYHDVLKDNYEWDEGYFFDLIEFKLKRMSQYFHTHNIVVDEDKYGDICDKAVNILNAGYKTNIISEEDLYNYVNTRNIHRFFKPRELEFIRREGLQKYYLSTVREAKAKALFWKYLYHNIEKLWE